MFLRPEITSKVKDLAKSLPLARRILRPLRQEKRRTVAQSTSPISGVAERYAGSLFDLAAQSNAVAAVEGDLTRFETLLDRSEDLQRLVKSPVFSADDQFKAIAAIADKAGIAGLTGNFLRVVARNRRLFAIPGMIKAFRRIAAEQRGEVSAEVTSAHALSPAQMTELKAALKGVAGKDVSLSVTVDPSLLGGLVVRIGSRQIDTSLKTKLNSLKLALKEVG
ncbi:F-type H+-transporting ATPase subunit delta [Rhizobiaceae bacterium]|nr:F-type H+-transporting ATPase subunit delta [Rhizobiaceae bacterium]